MEKSGGFSDTAGLGAIGLGAIFITCFDVICVDGFTLIAGIGIFGPELPASSLRIVFGATGIAKKMKKKPCTYQGRRKV